MKEQLSNNHVDAKPSKGRRALSNTALIVGAGGVGAVLGVAGITLRSHRELTHRSIELHPLLQKLSDLEQRSLGINQPTTWAAVHRIHHSMTDASLFPFYKINHAIAAAKERGIAVPESFGYLDPFVTSFSREQVEKIGTLADGEVRQRMGDTYVQPTFESNAEIEQILNPTGPTYYYPDYGKKTDYTQDDIAHILLTDPHSPALIGPLHRRNGVQTVVTKNAFLYKTTADMFRTKPDLKPEDLKTGNEGKEKSTKPAVIGGIALPAAAVLLFRAATKRGGFKPKDFAIAAATGATIYGVKAGLEVLGGGVVNSFGHAGKLDSKELFRAALKRDYKIGLKPDGTLATDTVYSGVAGKLLSWATFDEVGGQAYHHANPEAIAYTARRGAKGWWDAPWGSFIASIAKSKIPLINEGKGFDGPRPDVPHEGVMLIQKARAAEYAAANK